MYYEITQVDKLLENAKLATDILTQAGFDSFSSFKVGQWGNDESGKKEAWIEFSLNGVNVVIDAGSSRCFLKKDETSMSIPIESIARDVKWLMEKH